MPWIKLLFRYNSWKTSISSITLTRYQQVLSYNLTAIIYRILDHPKGLISHKIDITRYFSILIKIIYKWSMLLNEWLTYKVGVV